jgi:hypothetical protein
MLRQTFEWTRMDARTSDSSHAGGGPPAASGLARAERSKPLPVVGTSWRLVSSCCGGALAATRPRLSHPQSSPAALRPAALPAPEARPASDHHSVPTHSVPTTTNEAHGGHGARRLRKLRRCSSDGRASNGDVPRPTHRPHTPRQGILSRDHVNFCDRKFAGVCSPR